MLMNIWQLAPFVELLKGGSPVDHLCFFCLHWINCLSIPTVTQLNFTYSSKSSLLLAFCFLFVCMVDPTQMCP